MTEHLYFVFLKTTKKERKRQITIQHTTTAVDRGKLERRIKIKGNAEVIFDVSFYRKRHAEPFDT